MVLTPRDASRAVLSGEARLLDIREAYQADLAPVPEAIRIPLGTVLAEPDAVPRGSRLVVVDHDGSRLAFATRFLREQGVDAVGVQGGAIALLRDG